MEPLTPGIFQILFSSFIIHDILYIEIFEKDLINGNYFSISRQCHLSTFKGKQKSLEKVITMGATKKMCTLFLKIENCAKRDFRSLYVPTQNSDIFVRPKKVSLFWEMSLF